MAITSRPTSGGAALGLLVLSALAPVAAQDQSIIDFTRPERHFRVPEPADLSAAEASAIYERILPDMVAAYRLSRSRVAARYPHWQRFNHTPYRSETHGERFVNNYASREAAPTYGEPERGPMPVGAVLAKDAFTVTAEGDVFTGPLFLMEKMPAGFDAATGDWRYTMIMPDGSRLGTTGGDGSERVAFCASCHETAGAADDYLFFVPEAFRIGGRD